MRSSMEPPDMSKNARFLKIKLWKSLSSVLLLKGLGIWAASFQSCC